MNGRYTGRIVQYDEVKKFGFTETTEELPFGGMRIFTHQANSIETLSLGLYITFAVGNPYRLNRSPQAVKIMIVKEAVAVVEPTDVAVEIGVSQGGGQ